MNWFLKLKHWQLFALLFGLPIVLEILFFSTFFKNITAQNMDTSKFLEFFKFAPILVLLIVLISFGWYWAVGIKLQEKIPLEIRLKTGMFKFFVIFPLVYAISFSFAMYWLSSFLGGLQSGPIQLSDSIGPWIGFIPLLLFPLHFFAMFCLFYCMYFTARTIKTVELQRAARLDDYIGECFLIMFFPIGVWILQPRINKIIPEDSNSVYQPGSDFRMK